MSNQDPRLALHQLLLSLFSADELRRFIRYMPGGESVISQLPGPGASPASLADSAVEVLERHGLVTPEFFQHALAERPRRAADIHAVAQLWQAPRATSARLVGTGRAPMDAAPAGAVGSGPRGPVDAGKPAPTGGPEVQGDGLVRILHLSDFHFAEATAWDSRTCLGRLAADISRVRQASGAPDLVVLSGDIANTGQEKEYVQARAWIEGALLPAAGVDASQVIAVPGNHDVDRGKTRGTVVRSAQAELLKSGQQADVAALLAGEDAEVLLRRHAGFIKFADGLRLGGARWTLPWGSFRRTIRGVSVHVAAFSSAWLAAGDDDHGKLLLGLYQANQVLRDAETAELVVSVMHHPWGFFAAWDGAARAEVRRASSLVLRGHLHDSGQELVQGNANDRVQELAAGAAYESSESPNSYYWLEALPRAGALRIRPRFWDTKRREWRADRNLFETEVHEVPLRRAPSAR